MIYTISLNPTVDYDIYFDGFKETGLNYARNVNYRAAGKGINISKMLRNLGVESTVLGFAGGFTGRFIRDELKRLNIHDGFTDIAGTTRINTKINTLASDVVSGAEQEITGIAPSITEIELQSFYKSLSQIKSGDIVAFSGSIPKSVSECAYRKIAEVLPENVTTTLDTRGDILEKNIYNNALIKPNIYELSEMTRRTVDSEKSAAYYAEKLIPLGVEVVIVSLGAKGAVFVGSGLRLYAEAPEGKLVNTMGAGDSMIAGFIYGKIMGLNATDSFKMAVACGSATAFSPDMGSRELALNLFDKITLKELDM